MHHRTQMRDRAYLLSQSKRNEVLELWEVQRYGRDSFADPDYVSIYGLKPADWYARGVRLLARTVVECTRDDLGDRIGQDVAVVAHTAPGVTSSVVVDPFAGSGNTLYWITRRAAARRGVGFELDDAVFEATARNLSLVALGVELLHDGYERGLAAIEVSPDDLVIVFVAPPWGDALSDASGLDLRQTAPPVPAIVQLVAATFAENRLLFAIQIYERVDPASLAEVTTRFDWSVVKIYDIDAPGRNHGVLLGTRGWAPLV
jgi:hypothetical protein